MIFDRDENRITSGQVTLSSEEQKTLQVLIECRAGYRLYSEPVSSLSVEARRQGDVTWIDIETGEIDLSPWDATRQTFEIRLTADLTASRLRRRANIKVGR